MTTADDTELASSADTELASSADTELASSADTELASSLRLAVMRLARRMRAERADTALTLSQLSALSVLERLGAMTPRELAAAERVAPSSLTRIAASLEEQGLLTRTPHACDGRQVLLAASPAGLALVREDRRRREAWLAKQLDQLPPADLAVLRQAADVLDRLACS